MNSFLVYHLLANGIIDVFVSNIVKSYTKSITISHNLFAFVNWDLKEKNVWLNYYIKVLINFWNNELDQVNVVSRMFDKKVLLFIVLLYIIYWLKWINQA